jgi:hypothetical protein
LRREVNTEIGVSRGEHRDDTRIPRPFFRSRRGGETKRGNAQREEKAGFLAPKKTGTRNGRVRTQRKKRDWIQAGVYPPWAGRNDEGVDWVLNAES